MREGKINPSTTAPSPVRELNDAMTRKKTCVPSSDKYLKDQLFGLVQGGWQEQLCLGLGGSQQQPHDLLQIWGQVRIRGGGGSKSTAPRRR